MGRKRTREELSQERLLSKTPKPGSGLKDIKAVEKAELLADRAKKKFRQEGTTCYPVPDDLPGITFCSQVVSASRIASLVQRCPSSCSLARLVSAPRRLADRGGLSLVCVAVGRRAC